MITAAIYAAVAADTAGLGVTSDFIKLCLGAGGAGAITAGYKALKDFRDSSGKRSDGAVADLEKWRRNSDNARERSEARADYEAGMGRYWRDWAGTLEHVIRTSLPPEALPVQPPMPLPRPTFTTSDQP